MEATPVLWISARRAGIASPQAYVFHRSSRRARFRFRSPVLEEMASITDPTFFSPAICARSPPLPLHVDAKCYEGMSVAPEIRSRPFCVVHRCSRPRPNQAARLGAAQFAQVGTAVASDPSTPSGRKMDRHRPKGGGAVDPCSNQEITVCGSSCLFGPIAPVNVSQAHKKSEL
jgi:hypothetical protein